MASLSAATMPCVPSCAACTALLSLTNLLAALAIDRRLHRRGLLVLLDLLLHRVKLHSGWRSSLRTPESEIVGTWSPSRSA